MTATREIELQTGDKAPLFELPGDGGATLRLADFAGKPVIVYFYPKDDTSGCTSEAIAFSQLKPEFDKAGATVIGISPDSAAKHDKFKAKHDLTVSLAADEERRIVEAYGVWVEKQMYGRSYMGVERSTFLIGADGRIAQIWRNVRVKGHADAVLEATRAL
ncbi:thioredoxin-dependent thiol peroxidase [Aquamicrobium lusatiense]|uniref:thioredoxin-dependent thiol peroxidase n=1 Tax=Aquamicrobium lusatiense TaxID=89772 RepID=UPI002455024D|nr:thioredoxin-dependent thiol peroxidase [Aquamicrobium lusatiense]MDH4993060.1 thioredoxin-dependent thiol peroxidase [Aquamicrobium lusatiense]